MALTATFRTDFTAFYDAVRKATGDLTNFQKKADEASGSINKMVDTSASGFNTIKGAALGAVGALGVAFSINTVKNFAIGVIDAGAQIGDLSQKLGISATAVQKFGYAADQSGASINTVGTAIKAMNVNLAEGNKSTIAALTAAGLRFEDIRRLAPERAFVAIGDAVARIEDPMRRAQVATELFGRAGVELIPTFLAGITQIGDETAAMSDETVARLQAAQASWGKFSNAVTVYSGEAIGWIGKMGGAWQRTSKILAEAANPFKALPKAVQDLDLTADAAAQSASDLGAMIATLPAPTMAFARALPPVGMNAAQVTATIGYLNATIEKTPTFYSRVVASETAATTAREKYAAATKIAADQEFGWQKELALTKFKQDQLAVSETQLFDATETLASFVASHQGEMFPEPPPGSIEEWKKGQRTITEMPPQVGTLETSIENLAASFGQLGAISGDALNDTARQIGTVITAMQVAADAGQAMKAGFAKGGTEGYTQLATGAMGAVGAIDAATNSGKKAINVMSGMAAGAKAGMAFGPYGAAIGAAAGAITGFVKANSFEGKNVSPLRDAFFDMAGGIEVLNPQVEKLTGNLTLVQAVFNAKTVEDYNAAIANLNGLFKAEQDALATLTATADKYGLSIEELGPAMQRQNLDKQAQQLYKDWQVLNAAGIQTTVITARMAESVNQYTQDAVRMGVEVPEAMRPMLQQMVEMGTLTDASGTKIESLENSGITFALTMSEGFKGMIASVEKLADVLSRSLGVAIDTTTAKINKIPNEVPVEIKYTETGAVPDEGGGSVPGYARGTGGFVDFGAGTLAMLHGREAVVPESAVRNATSGGGAGVGGSPTIIINAQGAFFDTPGELQRLADKVNDALTAKYGLTNRARAA